MSKHILLTDTKGSSSQSCHLAIVDDRDYERINAFKWSAWDANRDGHHWYGRRYEGGKTVLMHREILYAEDGQLVDHVDGNGLDNRRHNLRFCTYAQNLMNQKKTHGSSPYKGVSWEGDRGVWRATIKTDGKVHQIGRFNIPEEAALAYDAAARQSFGRFARTNFSVSELSTRCLQSRLL